jgi:chemotaxis response regulator CheB
MAIAGPDGVDAAIKAGLDLDGTPIPAEMLALYNEVMALEAQRARSGVKKSMRNRIVKTGAKHFDQATLDARLKAAGWDGLMDKEIAFFYG